MKQAAKGGVLSCALFELNFFFLQRWLCGEYNFINLCNRL